MNKIIHIPYAIQIVIDDVGWWSGKDSHVENGPYRTGIERDHFPEDYEAIAYLGSSLGIRPVFAMIMCEWDRSSILKNLPDSTWMGSDWKYPGPSFEILDRAADIINNSRNNMEMAVHGIGHEFWATGVMQRAEWYDKSRKMRDEKTVRRHLDYFFELLKRNGLYDDLSFFVPAAFLYAFNEFEGDIAPILKEYGIKYVSTPHRTMLKNSSLQGDSFGVEHGILNVDRTVDFVNWLVINPQITGECTGPVLGMHWPNLLHEDPVRNHETVDRWIKLLDIEKRSPYKMLSPNAKEGFSQQVYFEKASVNVDMDSRTINFDFVEVDKLKLDSLSDHIYFKTPLSFKPELKENIVKINDMGDFSLYRLDRNTKNKIFKIKYTPEG